jgi:hypothetical protein
MDPEKELQRICDQYNGVFKVEDFIVSGPEMGESNHIVKISSKDSL